MPTRISIGVNSLREVTFSNARRAARMNPV